MKGDEQVVRPCITECVCKLFGVQCSLAKTVQCFLQFGPAARAGFVPGVITEPSPDFCAHPIARDISMRCVHPVSRRPTLFGRLNFNYLPVFQWLIERYQPPVN